MISNMVIQKQSPLTDEYGDGDQSPLKGNEAQKLRTQWVTGMDFHPSNLSYFYQACFVGDFPMVQQIVEIEEDVKGLIEKRETMMRFNAIFCIVQGVRSDVRSVLADDSRDTSGYTESLKFLISKGANIHAKDVAGYSVLFHCFTAYGNFAETSKLAKILLKAGADPNNQNRFGCTPLHENVMSRRFDVLDFLIENGADPSIADNNGVTPNYLSILFPEVQLLFSKAGSLIGNKKRKEAKATGDHGKCYLCGKAGSKKRCTRCLVALYCNRECQVEHWQEHKKDCIKKQKGKVDVGLSNYPREFFVNFSIKTGEMYITNGDVPDKSYFKVKIQLPYDSFDTKKKYLLVYDKRRTFQKTIESDNPNYDKIVNKIRTEGVMKVKGYFYASLKPDGNLSLQVDHMLPPESW